jgi:DNA-binding transcriptional LysR family regulator
MNYIKGYVASGLGISVGPRLTIEPEDRNDLGVIGLRHLFPEAEAGYATLARRMLPNSVELLVQSLAKPLGEN